MRLPGSWRTELSFQQDTYIYAFVVPVARESCMLSRATRTWCHKGQSSCCFPSSIPMARIRWDGCLASVSTNSDWDSFFSWIYNPRTRTGLRWLLPFVLVGILQHQLALDNFLIQQSSQKSEVWNQSFILNSQLKLCLLPETQHTWGWLPLFLHAPLPVWSLGPLYLAVAVRIPGRRRCTHCSSSVCAFHTLNPSGSWAPRRLGQAKSGAVGGSGHSSGSGNCENEEGTHNPCKEKKGNKGLA